MLASKINIHFFRKIIIYVVLFVDLIISFIYAPLTFTSSVYSNEHKWFLVLLPLNTALVLLNFKRIIYKIRSSNSITVVCSIILLLFLSCSPDYSFSNQHFSCLAISFLVFNSFLLVADSNEIENIVFVLFLVYLFELALGIYQLAMAFRFQTEVSFSLVGTFTNSGVFACYLSVMLPIALYQFFYLKKRFKFISSYAITKKIALIIIILLTLIIIFLTRSRTALFSLSIIILGVIYFEFHAGFLFSSAKLIKKILLISFVVTIAAFISLLYFKKNSLVGRFQMSFISAMHVGGGGTGLGKFTNYYPNWQSEFYKENSYPTIFLHNVGENYVIFNEYLQLLAEVGILGFLLFSCFIFLLFFNRKSESRSIHSVLQLTSFGILSCGITSYPLHVSALLFVLGFCAVALIKVNKYKYLPKLPLKNEMLSVVLMGCLVCTYVYTSYLSCKRLTAINEWEIISKNYTLSRTDSKSNYRRLLNVLQFDGKYAAQFGIYLSLDSSDCNEATMILEEANKRFTSRMTCEALINAYEKKGDNVQAIKHAEWVVNYLPHLFVPKYILLKLYIKVGQTGHAIGIARHILNTPEKVPSGKVSEIRKFAIEYLSVHK